MTVSPPAVAQGPEATVSRWIDAFNARDLTATPGCLDPDVDFHPLRLHGLDGGYRGRDGDRAWFARLERAGHRHRLAVAEVRAAGADRMLASASTAWR